MQFLTKRTQLINKVSEITNIKYNKLFNMMLEFDKYPRIYHSSDNHILDLCEKILMKYNYDTKLCRILLYKAIFHDYIYDPKAKDNEEKSAVIWLTYAQKNGIDDKTQLAVYDGIIDTINHVPRTDISRMFCELDLSGFDDKFDKVLENEYKIRKEYDWVDWDIYKIEKIKFLQKYSENSIIYSNLNSLQNIHRLILHIIHEKTPSIAVYPGSFNPFHIGHRNILEKAEQIFDKVIIAFGQNPEKEKLEKEVPEYLKYKQVDFYDGSLPAYLRTKSYSPTIIRGLRNSTDLQYELDFYREMQYYYDKNVKIVSIFCDVEHQSISSSSIRFAQRYEDLKEKANKLKV